MGSAPVILEGFAAEAECAALIALHQARRPLLTDSDNGLDLLHLGGGFDLLRRMVAQLEASFGVRLGCDHARLCAIPAGPYVHARHADAIKADGSPNHTPWRTHTTLLYLNESDGGLIVFDEPVQPRPGLLVLMASDVFHHTTPVASGARYSMNCWWTNTDTRIRWRA